jgi:pimeloyl-ACP methyl ester carboxylesterase
MPADDTALTAPTQLVEARNGVSYAYRRFGRPAVGVPPVTMLQHYRGCAGPAWVRAVRQAPDEYDTSILAGDLAALMDALGHRRCALARHDAGMWRTAPGDA